MRMNFLLFMWQQHIIVVETKKLQHIRDLKCYEEHIGMILCPQHKFSGGTKLSKMAEKMLRINTALVGH
ncbi:hypothetical protein DMN91_009783 [Ooceraea biroi]|uniref:Uncharacterized protein n=1 Tax=Ooceraea biroi TaxID=2015173 RepID=A0A3L8DAN8_OOCBI|nr:hypothetical protein DMN91_009783 [Ooceraea biroi]